MALITFLSDFGHKDHYVAAVKARIIRKIESPYIIDISHSIKSFNIPHAAYVLRSCFSDFPVGSVHLVAVETPLQKASRYLALKLDGHYFVGQDSGLFSLISDNEPEEVVEIRSEKASVFPAANILAPAAADLASGEKLSSLGDNVSDMVSMLDRQLKVTGDMIFGNIVHVDHYGNLITNITREVFEKTANNRQFKISFSRYWVEKVREQYSARDGGDCIAVWNSQGLLEISIFQGNASELLGLDYDSPVRVKFQKEASGTSEKKENQLF